MLRTRFKDTTLVTVAHRLNTIMDYDCILGKHPDRRHLLGNFRFLISQKCASMCLVMDNGHAVEFGRPDELLDSNGVFAELIDSTGVESSRALREIAKATASSAG